MNQRIPRVCDDCRYVTSDFIKKCPHCNFVCSYENSYKHLFYVREINGKFYVMCTITYKPLVFKKLAPKLHFVEAQSQLNKYALSHGFKKIESKG